MKKIFFCLILAPFIAMASAPSVPGEYIVKVSPERADVLSRVGGDVTEVDSDGGVYKIKFSGKTSEQSFLNQTKSRELGFEYVEPNYIYTIDSTNATVNDPRVSRQWGMFGTAGINLERAWELSHGSDDVIVGVVDTGIDYNHEDLRTQMWKNSLEASGKPGVDDDNNGFVDDVYGFNFITGRPDPKDDNSHGTHCAGVIGAATNNGIGVASPNRNIRLMALKFLSAQGSGTTEGAIRAIKYGVKMKANILSNSWGGGGKSQALVEAIKEAEKAGVLFISAAGNSGESLDRKSFYPASIRLSNTISVAATTSQGGLATFSNFGKKNVDIAAPGSYILSTVPGSRYGEMSGTSMAAPHVSAVAAMVLARYPNATAVEIKAKILKGGRPVDKLKTRVNTGMTLDAFGALK